jgi:hypothetical protein
MTGAELVLDRALQHARAGQPNPGYCLIMARRDLVATEKEVLEGEGAAMMAVIEAAGGSLVQWYEGQRRSAHQTVELLEEALFNVQMRGP